MNGRLVSRHSRLTVEDAPCAMLFHDSRVTVIGVEHASDCIY